MGIFAGSVSGSGNGSEGGSEGGSGPTGLLKLFYLMSLITYTHILTETHSHLLALTLTHSLSMYLAKVNEIREFMGQSP